MSDSPFQRAFSKLGPECLKAHFDSILVGEFKRDFPAAPALAAEGSRVRKETFTNVKARLSQVAAALERERRRPKTPLELVLAKSERLTQKERLDRLLVSLSRHELGREPTSKELVDFIEGPAFDRGCLDRRYLVAMLGRGRGGTLAPEPAHWGDDYVPDYPYLPIGGTPQEALLRAAGDEAAVRYARPNASRADIVQKLDEIWRGGRVLPPEDTDTDQPTP